MVLVRSIRVSGYSARTNNAYGKYIASDGNLGSHLQKLEDAEYIEVIKTFEARRPKTYVAATDKGRVAFSEHIEALKEIIGMGTE